MSKMPWYVPLIIALIVQVAFALLIWWWMKKHLPVSDVRLAAEKSKVTRLEEEIALEKKTAAELAGELKRFSEEQKRIAVWYEQHKMALEKDAGDALQKLASDPAAIDARLDQLLGKR